MKALTTLSQNPSPSTITTVARSVSQSTQSMDQSALNLSMPKLEPVDVEDSKAKRKFSILQYFRIFKTPFVL